MKRILAMLVVLGGLAACTKDTSEWKAPGTQTSTAEPTRAPSVAAPVEDTPAPVATLRIGDRVSAEWPKNKKWYPGRITAVYSDGTADIRYDDGDRWRGLPFDKIKLVKRPLFEAEVSPPTK